MIEDALRFIRDDALRARLLSVKADRLDELGRTAEAEEARALLTADPEESDDVLYIDDALDEDLALAVDLEDAAEDQPTVDASQDQGDAEPDDDGLTRTRPTTTG